MKNKELHLRKIVSGGQTGVDRAALDAAVAAGIPIGGWCPKGRLAEDGVISLEYPLRETVSRLYRERTGLNVMDSDGTLILAEKILSGGTALTKGFADKYAKPLLVVNPADSVSIGKIKKWLTANKIKVLNVAGPRESTRPGSYDQAYKLLGEVLSATQKKEFRIQNSGVRMEPGNSRNRGTVAMTDNPMEGCALSQPSSDPGVTIH